MPRTPRCRVRPLRRAPYYSFGAYHLLLKDHQSTSMFSELIDRSSLPTLKGWVSETGIWGGQNVPNARWGGGELAPKVAPRRLGLLTPKLKIFYRISVERGQFQGALEIQNFHPLIAFFGRVDPPYPGLQGYFGVPQMGVYGMGV